MKQATTNLRCAGYVLIRCTLLRLLMILPFFLGLNATATQAQISETEQSLNALQQSFLDRDIKAVRPFLSPKLQMGPLPATNTPAILRSVFTKFPPLKGYRIVEETQGEVLVEFEFEQLGKQTSYIHFDESGKLTKITFLDKIIEEQIRTQNTLEDGVKAPQPGALAEKFPFETVRFKAADGLEVSGNLYHIGRAKPVILLCHQANYNKHEYADIAPKLNEMGYNVMAIDQRSGGDLAGTPNETLQEAIAAGINDIDFLDAEQDIVAAIDYLAATYRTKVILWGSSYSSSLALFIAQSHPEVIAAIAFSPGNYFGDRKPILRDIVSQLDKPLFITSSREEADIIAKTIGRVLREEDQVQFIPESSGFHGSKALWEGQEGAEAYWSALTKFLNSISLK